MLSNCFFLLQLNIKNSIFCSLRTKTVHSFHSNSAASCHGNVPTCFSFSESPSSRVISSWTSDSVGAGIYTGKLPLYRHGNTGSRIHSYIGMYSYYIRVIYSCYMFLPVALMNYCNYWFWNTSKKGNLFFLYNNFGTILRIIVCFKSAIWDLDLCKHSNFRNALVSIP